ncbi:MAG: hypothetical protein LBG74_02115 [Spirochaetaceae bacterium]|nr:hypothetical protein [Spirochaetaceae bacterium]
MATPEQRGEAAVLGKDAPIVSVDSVGDYSRTIKEAAGFSQGDSGAPPASIQENMLD